MDFSKLIQYFIESWRKFDKQTKLLLKALLFSVLTLLVFGFGKFLWDTNQGKPAEFLFLYNYVKPDTIYKERIVFQRDTSPTIKSDIKAKNAIGVVYGNPQVGDVYQKGIKQRVVTNEVIAEIVKNIPNNDITVSICRTLSDKESEIYAIDIENALKKRGFNIGTKSYYTPTKLAEFERITYELIYGTDTVFIVYINPVTNIEK